MAPISFALEELRRAYRAGVVTPQEVAAEALARIAAYDDPAVWIARLPEDAIMARAGALRHAARDLPLYGIPFAVKDNIDVAGIPTTAACPAFAHVPAADAPVVARLLAAGAILLGKTNLDQFATGLVGTRSPYGAPRCVFNNDFVSGGSSSGSAVAVAAGLCSFALGTDTAGSGRVPAAFNNIVGLKPSRGLVSTNGVVPACRTLDCVSIFSATAEAAHAVFAVAKGFDLADPYSRREQVRALPVEGLQVGIVAAQDREFFGEAENAALYDQATARMASLGHDLVEIDFAPFREAGALLYGGGWTAERLAATETFLKMHESDMDPTVRSIIAGARKLTAVDAFRGQYALAQAARAAEAEWTKMDVLLLPTAPIQETVAAVNADPIARNAKLGTYTNFVNLLDYAAIAVPAGFRADGLAFGVTLIAPAFSDDALAALAGQRIVPRGWVLEKIARPIRPEERNMDMIDIFVVGAHLTGMPLNKDLVALGASFRRAVRTAPDYRFFALPGTTPPKPGLIHEPGHQGPGIAGEIWTLPADGFGRFVAMIPAPLGVGKVMLEDGTEVSGFLCEAYAVHGARDITGFGGWIAYMKSLA